ncbi:cell division protein FtsQ/DivIB [Streptacidiphilus jiangxiensis]|uniref:Cell division protein FtsQ n=1 Tax=Streptacidiphilus jiangxiensis TaxID=235985 RepID=A0A1H7SN43_STRJI|nr:FtsQ-type POTRA domain-containing protein [Streptacidiphilus jiangxiensis]SEL73799.1 cell division protein FtsQ [Streptacidiphilus jiangxiensis]
MAEYVGVEEDRAEAGAEQAPRPRLKLSRRGIAVLSGLVAVLLGTGIWLVWFSSVFDVRTVSVIGAKALTRDQVLQAAQVPLGGPLERLDTGAVEARVEKALPRVDHADVTTSWPHAVTITVTERTPVAAVRGANGTFTLEDTAGVRFATLPAAPPGVPVVQLALSAAGKGELAQFPEQVLVAGAVEVARSLPAALARRTAAVVVHSYDDIELTLNGPSGTVYWGSPEQSARKAVVLGALLKQDARGYDVSAPTDPALRS